MEIKYRFYKKQQVNIRDIGFLELHHYDKETFKSTLAKGRVEVVTMCSFKNNAISRFYVFVKYPGESEFEFIKQYRASQRSKILLDGIR